MKKRNPGLDGVASLVFNMEQPLAAIESLSLMICYFAETLDENEGRALQQVSWTISGEAKEIMKLRSYVIDGLRNCGADIAKPAIDDFSRQREIPIRSE